MNGQWPADTDQPNGVDIPSSQLVITKLCSAIGRFASLVPQDIWTFIFNTLCFASFLYITWLLAPVQWVVNIKFGWLVWIVYRNRIFQLPCTWQAILKAFLIVVEIAVIIPDVTVFQCYMFISMSLCKETYILLKPIIHSVPWLPKYKVSMDLTLCCRCCLIIILCPFFRATLAFYGISLAWRLFIIIGSNVVIEFLQLGSLALLSNGIEEEQHLFLIPFLFFEVWLAVVCLVICTCAAWVAADPLNVYFYTGRFLVSNDAVMSYELGRVWAKYAVLNRLISTSPYIIILSLASIVMSIYHIIVVFGYYQRFRDTELAIMRWNFNVQRNVQGQGGPVIAA